MAVKHTFGLICVLTTLLFASCLVSDVSADTEPDKVFYCYTYDLGFIYSGGTVGNIEVEWEATGVDYNGNNVEVHQIEPYPTAENDWRVKYNPEDVRKCSEITVTQTVTRDGISDSQTFKVIILVPPENGKYVITYYDGYSGSIYHIDEITANKYVEAGSIHVSLPQPPERDGFSFQGWYLDEEYSERFDETMPIQSDLSLYAKWANVESDDSLILVLIILAAIIVMLLVVLIIVLIRMRKQRT